jgi:hypothetical protein
MSVSGPRPIRALSETMDTYSHYLPDMQEEAIGELGRILA